MLAETLQEWDEQKFNEGRRAGRAEVREEGRLAGREEGRQAGREEERARLRKLVRRHFDAATANTLVRLINAAD